MRALVASAFCVVSSMGCALDDEATTDDGVEEISSNPLGMYFVQLRHDTRRCISPVCGGFWVHRVGRATTRCADGNYRAECYVAEADYTALGLDERALGDVAGHGDVIFRGRVEAHTYGSFGNLGQLVVTDAYTPASAATPTGDSYAVRDNGIRCVRAPCPSIDAVRLNGPVAPTLVSRVDFSRVAGVTRAAIQKAGEQMASDGRGVLVAGALSGAGSARILTASQFWFRVSDGVADDQFCTADTDCRRGLHTRPVESSSDCYCALCPNSLINATFASAYESAYRRSCTAFARSCPVARCAAPAPVACVRHACATAPEGVGVGETCGGIAALRCAAGLACVIADNSHPDASGVCRTESGLGGPCGGFTRTPAVCAEGLRCVYGRIPDLPGTCQR